MADDLPRPTPEGELIRRVRNLSIPKLSIPAAAARIGLSAEQWGYVERGYYPARDGNPPRPFSPPAATLAKMAGALRISPDRLESEGQRPDAAKILREILCGEPQPAAKDGGEPDLSLIAKRTGRPASDIEILERLAAIQRELGSPINYELFERLAAIWRELGNPINLDDDVEKALAAQSRKPPHVIAMELREWQDHQRRQAEDADTTNRDAG